MKIKCLTTFLDGTDRFEKDDQRTVSDEDGARFVTNGWAEDLSGAVQTGAAVVGDTTITPNSATHGQEVTNG